MQGSENMPEYRCYFYGSGNHIVEREEYIVATDEPAIVEARVWYAERKSKQGPKFGSETAFSTVRIDRSGDNGSPQRRLYGCQ